MLVGGSAFADAARSTSGAADDSGHEVEVRCGTMAVQHDNGGEASLAAQFIYRAASHLTRRHAAKDQIVSNPSQLDGVGFVIDSRRSDAYLIFDFDRQLAS